MFCSILAGTEHTLTAHIHDIGGKKITFFPAINGPHFEDRGKTANGSLQLIK